MPVHSLPELWQCIGMIVGVYGVGYWIAARDPFTHWPIIVVGLLGKILGPVGYVNSLLKGSFTWKAGLMNVTNDLIWWAPFTLILLGAWRHHRRA
jgi:small multidrug resistance pump